MKNPTGISNEKDIISNENPFYERIPGGYRESYVIIRCQPLLSNAEKILYDELIFYYIHSGKNGYKTAFPKIETLGLKLGRSTGAISRTLKRLVDHELIEIKHRKVSGNRHEYVLKPYPIWIWDQYFLMLENEAANLQGKDLKAKKEQIEATFLKFRNLNFKNLNFRKLKFKLESSKLQTLESSSSKDKNPSTLPADNNASDDQGEARNHQSHKSEKNHHYKTSNLCERQNPAAGQEIDDDYTKNKNQPGMNLNLSEMPLSGIRKDGKPGGSMSSKQSLERSEKSSDKTSDMGKIVSIAGALPPDLTVITHIVDTFADQLSIHGYIPLTAAGRVAACEKASEWLAAGKDYTEIVHVIISGFQKHRASKQAPYRINSLNYFDSMFVDSLSSSDIDPAVAAALGGINQ